MWIKGRKSDFEQNQSDTKKVVSSFALCGIVCSCGCVLSCGDIFIGTPKYTYKELTTFFSTAFVFSPFLVLWQFDCRSLIFKLNTNALEHFCAIHVDDTLFHSFIFHIAFLKMKHLLESVHRISRCWLLFCSCCWQCQNPN